MRTFGSHPEPFNNSNYKIEQKLHSAAVIDWARFNVPPNTL